MRPTGYVVYRGLSSLDKTPIVAVLTGFGKASRNAKTGDMLQLWILPDAGVDPVQSAATGADKAVCGDCPHRGRMVDGRNVGRSCYVSLFQAPLSVWNAAQRGVYPTAPLFALRELVAGRRVRLGAYGDPAALPFEVCMFLAEGAAAVTGYTHQWRQCDQRFRQVCMASCDDAFDRLEAKAMGWRTFRVRRDETNQLDEREISCPASEEAGNRTDCASCRACGGLGAKARVDIAIVIHGPTSKVNAFRSAA